MSFSFGKPTGQIQNKTMATPATSTAGRPDQEIPRFANMTDTVTIKTEALHSFTVHTSLLLQESAFFKQQEKFLVENKCFDLPAPYKADAFEAFVGYLYANEVSKSITADKCIDAYKLGKFLKAERFTGQCRKIAESRMTLKFPHPRLSHVGKLADLTDDPLKTFILDQIAYLILDGIYANSQEVTSQVDELSANETAQSVYKELLASIILRAERRSEEQPALYGHSNRGPDLAAARASSGGPPADQKSAAQGLFGNNNPTKQYAGGLFGSGGGLLGNQQLCSNTPAGIFGQTSNHGLVGNNATQTNTSGGISGVTSTQHTNDNHTCKGIFATQANCAACDRENKSNTGGGLFGNNSRTIQQPGGLFGTAKNNTNHATSGGGIFGQAHPSSGTVFSTHASTSGSGFGAPMKPYSLFRAPQTSRLSGGVFGQAQPTSNMGGFPFAKTREPQQANTTSGLLGNSNATTGGFTLYDSNSRGVCGAFGGFGTDQTTGLEFSSSGGCGRFGCYAKNRCRASGCASDIGPAAPVDPVLCFQPHTENEYDGRIIAYQSIAATPAYSKLSHEEMRLHHYNRGSEGEKKGELTYGSSLASLPNAGHSSQVTTEAQKNTTNHDAELASKNTEIEGLRARIARLELANARPEKQPDTDANPVDSPISERRLKPDLGQSVQNLQTRFDNYAKQQVEILTKLNTILAKSANPSGSTASLSTAPRKAKVVRSIDTTSAQISGMSTPQVIFTPKSSTSTTRDGPGSTVHAEQSNDHGTQTIDTKEKAKAEASPSDDLTDDLELQTYLSTNAKNLYKYLKDSSEFNNGLDAEAIAHGMNLEYADVCQAADELFQAGLTFTTVDDHTWAVLDF